MKTKISTPNAPLATGPFSQAIKVENMLFTSGQIYLTTEGKLLEGSIEEQARQVLNNLKAIVEEAGFTFSDVVKATIYTTDMSLYGQINTIYGEYFSDSYPAREVVCVSRLPLDAKLEISLVAVKSD